MDPTEIIKAVSQIAKGLNAVGLNHRRSHRVKLVNLWLAIRGSAVLTACSPPNFKA